MGSVASRLPTRKSPPIKRADSPVYDPILFLNAVASSSKVSLEQIPSPNMLGLRDVMDSAAKEQPDVLSSAPIKQTLANLHPLALRPSDNVPPSSSLARRPLSLNTSKQSSPPPDPKSLAYISSGPLLNPLNIRPSSTSAIQSIPSQPNAKKRIVVGNGWPHVRQANGNTSGSFGTQAVSSSFNQASKTQAETLESQLSPQLSLVSSAQNRSSTGSRISPGLSGIASYSSPSPPASSRLLNPNPRNKWKPVVDDSSQLDPGNRPIASPVNGQRHINDMSSTPSHNPTVESKYCPGELLLV